MRELILLRHANAEPVGPGQSDYDRALSSQGLMDAAVVGRWLAARRLIPDRVLCSSARRTRETLEAVLDAIGDVEYQLERSIYHAAPRVLLELLKNQHDVERLMVIGHNPTMTQLVSMLCGQSVATMATASAAVLALVTEDVIEPGQAKRVAFWQGA